MLNLSRHVCSDIDDLEQVRAHFNASRPSTPTPKSYLEDALAVRFDPRTACSWLST